ncbi:hypothetical protein DFH06DRAFT_1158558 [Mycena polygramma]|nr:hypothetical protein DFH06DRAFT_1158558 [Mycena polygramma]
MKSTAGLSLTHGRNLTKACPPLNQASLRLWLQTYPIGASRLPRTQGFIPPRRMYMSPLCYQVGFSVKWSRLGAPSKADIDCVSVSPFYMTMGNIESIASTGSAGSPYYSLINSEVEVRIQSQSSYVTMLPGDRIASLLREASIRKFQTLSMKIEGVRRGLEYEEVTLKATSAVRSDGAVVYAGDTTLELMTTFHIVVNLRTGQYVQYAQKRTRRPMCGWRLAIL